MSFLSSLLGSNQTTVLPAAPLPPAANTSDAAAREAAALEERRRRIAAGRMVTNPTGGLGDASTPSLASKSLLGM